MFLLLTQTHVLPLPQETENEEATEKRETESQKRGQERRLSPVQRQVEREKCVLMFGGGN